MRKYISTLIILFIASEAFAQNINTPENFPDPNFRAAIEETMGVEPGGEFTADQAAQIKEIGCGNMGITDLTGLEFFTSLYEMWCNDNMITHIDFSPFPELNTLRCYNNQITELDFSNNPDFYFLNSSGNPLTKLDVTQNPNIISLFISDMQLTELDVSNVANLQYLDCGRNNLTKLDVSNNNKLYSFDCSYNQLTEIDVSNNTSLGTLYCSNNQLTDITSFVENRGLNKSDLVDIRNNHLDLDDPEIMDQIIQLQEKVGEAVYGKNYWGLVEFTSGLEYLPQVGSMMVEDIVDVVGAIRNGLNEHDMDMVMPFIAEDFTAEHSWDVNVRDAQQYKEGWENIFRAFPDEEFFEINTIAGDSIVFEEAAMQGTHMEEWGGLPPTGEKGDPWRYLNVWDYEGLTMKHLTMYGDMQTVMINAKVMLAPELPPLIPSFPIPAMEGTGLSPLEASIEMGDRWNDHDLIAWIKIFNDFVPNIYLSVPGMQLNLEEVAAVFEMNFTGFPDVHGDVVRKVDCGDGWILTESICHGTHTGPWFGIPPTGRTYEGLRVAQVERFYTDGSCIYSHTYYDNMTVLAQLGLLETSSNENWELYE